MIELVQPDSELQVSIRRQFNENLKTRQRELETIKDWLRKQPHLPDTWDEHRILTFLRGCNFSLEKCKNKLDMYFTMRTALPEFFANRDIKRPEMQAILKIGMAPTLPGLTPDGRRVTVFRCEIKNFEVPNVADAIKLAFMIGDLRLKLEETGVSGDIFIADAGCITWSHFAKTNPITIKKFLICAQQAYPVKVKEVHVINASPLVDTIVQFVRPFVKAKIMDRVHVHSSLESLHKFVPKEMLPVEFGGLGEKTQVYMDQWLKTLEDHEEWFKEEEKVKADESRRPGKPTNYDNLFGLEGSFKQLSID